jgi:hypothetical protein
VLRCETELLDKFCIDAHDFLNMIERECLRKGMSRIEPLAAITVMQHYGVPTRLLDWTTSPWVAAYFACIGSRKANGVVWMFDSDELCKSADRRWKEMGVEKADGAQVNLNDLAFTDPPQNWIVSMGLQLPFPRMEAQQGWFTVAGSVKANHDEEIDRTVPQNCREKIVIPAEHKSPVIEMLRVMNVHASSIQYAGADLVGSGLITARLDAME